MHTCATGFVLLISCKRHFIISSTLILAADWSISLFYWTVSQSQRCFSLIVNFSIPIHVFAMVTRGFISLEMKLLFHTTDVASLDDTRNDMVHIAPRTATSEIVCWRLKHLAHNGLPKWCISGNKGGRKQLRWIQVGTSQIQKGNPCILFYLCVRRV